jgi:hypothetical protein
MIEGSQILHIKAMLAAQPISRESSLVSVE